MKHKVIRAKQRFQNFEKAYNQLKKGLELPSLNELERQGIIKSFEFTFELAWKTLKDYLESQEIEATFPRQVIKQAFHYELIDQGEVWIEILEKRNLMAHTYDEAKAKEALTAIKNFYFNALSGFRNDFKTRLEHEND